MDEVIPVLKKKFPLGVEAVIPVALRCTCPRTSPVGTVSSTRADPGRVFFFSTDLHIYCTELAICHF